MLHKKEKKEVKNKRKSRKDKKNRKKLKFFLTRVVQGDIIHIGSRKEVRT